MPARPRSFFLRCARAALAIVPASACTPTPAPTTAPAPAPTPAPALAEPEPAPARATPIVLGESWQLQSRHLGELRSVHVWTPPSYSRDSSRRYPVLFLLDGGLEQDFHHITGLAQLGALSGLTDELVVVGIETVDRRRELTFPIERDATLKKEYPTAGHASAFRRFVGEEVRPFIDAEYRTSDRAAIMGESLAGLFVVETLLDAPDTFDTYIAIDPSLWWDDGRLATEAPTRLADGQPTGARLWLSIGRETSQQRAPIDALLKALRAHSPAGLELRFEPRPDRTHATIYHPTAQEALHAFYPARPAPPR